MSDDRRRFYREKEFDIDGYFDKKEEYYDEFSSEWQEEYLMEIAMREERRIILDREVLLSMLREQKEILRQRLEKSSKEEMEAKKTAQEENEHVAVSPETEAKIENLSGGEPLDKGTKEHFEESFGEDFSDVRIHTDKDAAETAEEVNARAFAKGEDIVFNEGEFEQNTQDGKQLLAHEVAHVADQSKKAENMIFRAPKSPQQLTAKSIIDAHTSAGILNEKALGFSLYLHARKGRYNLVIEVINELWSTNRDDVAKEMVKKAGDEALLTFAQSPFGRDMLIRLYDELTSGALFEDEQIQANRILQAIGLSNPAGQYPQDIYGIKIFPITDKHSWLTGGPSIQVKPIGKGKIWVKVSSYVYTTGEYPESKTLPDAAYLPSGIILNAHDIVGIKMYDEGGITIYRPALFLLQCANKTDAHYRQLYGEATVLGISLGVSAVATSSLSGGVRALTLTQKLISYGDKAATAIYVLTRIMQENRGWIISRFGDTGRKIIHYTELVNDAMMIYGGARLVYSMGKLVNNYRVAYQQWYNDSLKQKDQLSSSQVETINIIINKTDDFFDNAAKIRGKKYLPKGFTKTTWHFLRKALIKFTNKIKKEYKIEGELIVHGSRIKETSTFDLSNSKFSDLDVMLRVDRKTFDYIVHRRLSELHPSTKYYNDFLKESSKGKISNYFMGKDFSNSLWEHIRPYYPNKFKPIDYSIIVKENTKATGPFLILE